MALHSSSAHRWRSILLIGLLFGILPTSALYAEETHPAILDLPLEELLNIRVTSVSKKEQRVNESASAIYVITHEDIRRSGATTLPEALRMAPGVHVAKIAGGQYAIGVRGFNGIFTAKLLVLIDGRSIYHMMTAGVWWDQHDIVLEDVERIEVIRGPGATLWGSNAVNGVINIITKSAKQTKGTMVSAHAGSEEKLGSVVRHGDSVGPTDYRLYAKYSEHDNGKLSDGGDAFDSWQTARAGFRSDTSLTADDKLTFSGEGHSSTSGWDVLAPSLSSIQEPEDFRRRDEGAFAMGKWTETLSAKSELQVQAYYEYGRRRDELFGFTNHIANIDLQHRLPLSESHDLIWGVEARQYRDDFDETFAVQVQRDSETMNLYTWFLQDEITLVPDRLKLILGSKFEVSNYSDFEFQPNVRAIYMPSHDSSFWAGVSRANRTPARYHRSGDITPAIVPGTPETGGLPVRVRYYGQTSLDAENLMAYETGYRVQLSQDLSVDTQLFYNNYRELQSAEPQGTPVFVNDGVLPPHIEMTLGGDNKLQGESKGAEISLDYRVDDWWRTAVSYSYLNVNLQRVNGGTDFIYYSDRENTPANQVIFRSMMDLPCNFELDTIARFIDSAPAYQVAPYFEADIRLGWRPSPELEVSIVGQNLFHDSHREYRANFIASPDQESERGVYGKVTWLF